jgi:hypothetical protein
MAKVHAGVGVRQRMRQKNALVDRDTVFLTL